MRPVLTKTDHFAELLSQGLGVYEAGERAGFSAVQSRDALRRIRRKLGPQAVWRARNA